MLLSHAFGIVAHPTREWQEIRKEHAMPTRLFVAYICLLAAIAPICAYISTTEVGWRVADGALIKLTSESALMLSGLTYLAMLVGVFVLGYIIDWMSKTYGAERDEFAANGIALMAYACTPLFLAGFAVLYPVPWVNMAVFVFAAACSGYLLHKGLPIVMRIPEERAFLFEGAILTGALVYLVSTRVGTVIIWSLGVGPVFVDG
jgi:hypothetical protein